MPASYIGLFPVLFKVTFISIVLSDWFKFETVASLGVNAALVECFVVKLIVVVLVLFALSIAVRVIVKSCSAFDAAAAAKADVRLQLYVFPTLLKFATVVLLIAQVTFSKFSSVAF